MKRIQMTAVSQFVGEKVTVSGFADSVRSGKTMAFVVLKDITGSVQITLDKNALPEIAEQLSALTPDSVVTVTGTVCENASVHLGGLEIIPEKLSVHSLAAPLPIRRKDIPASRGKAAALRSALDARLDYRWIDLRAERNQLLFKVQTALVAAMRDFLLRKDFIEIHTPKLISAASESGADVFEVEYFGRKAYLAQSPQFYKQMAMAAGFERVFETGPVFRAEKSYTARHTTEFTGFDLELSFIESYRDVMALQEDMLIDALSAVKERYGKAIEEHFGVPLTVPMKPFPVVKLRDLYAALEKEYGYRTTETGDLTTQAEQMSYQWVQKHFGHEFLFVTDYSAENRAFYHMRDINGVPQGYDLIWKGVEITTGAQREHRYEILKRQAQEKGLGEDIRFYLEFFRYGCPPHGGFGMGIDRLMMLLTDLHINETMFLFRSPKRLTP